VCTYPDEAKAETETLIKYINIMQFTREQLSQMDSLDFLKLMGYTIETGSCVWNGNGHADKYAFTETTKDGYDLFVFTDNPNKPPQICQGIFYDEDGFWDGLKEYIIEDGTGEEVIAIEDHVMETMSDWFLDEDEMVEIATNLDMFVELQTENGLDVDEVKEYYLNSGFPQYDAEPYKSYTDEDWIDHANENELER